MGFDGEGVEIEEVDEEVEVGGGEGEDASLSEVERRSPTSLDLINKGLTRRWIFTTGEERRRRWGSWRRGVEGLRDGRRWPISGVDG